MKQSEAKKKKRKIMLIATLGTAAIIIGGLTFAWYTSQDSVTNTFKTDGTLKTVVVENFTPPTNWQPGVTTDKVVQVTNTGTIDAYTRVQLSEDLTFYSRGDKVKLEGTATSDTSEDNTSEDAADAGSSSSTGTTKYITVNKNAIIDAVNAWNSDSNNTDDFELINGTEYASLIDSTLLTNDTDNYDSDGVHLWIKEATANTKDKDGATIETGKNLQFLGYYVEGGEAYELDIDADIKYLGLGEEETVATAEESTEETTATTATTATSNPSVDTTNKSEFTDYLDLTKSSITLSRYKAVEKTVTDNDIKDYVEIEFANDGKWFYNVDDDYFYYTSILNSGESTTPLIKAVRMKDSVGDEMLNATYNLKVYSDSTQATNAAATAIFNIAPSTFKTSNFTIEDDALAGCDYSKTNRLVCSDDTNEVVASFNNKRGQKKDKNVSTNTTTATATTETTTIAAD